MQTPLGLLYDSGLIYNMALTKGIKMGMGVEGGCLLYTSDAADES